MPKIQHMSTDLTHLRNRQYKLHKSVEPLRVSDNSTTVGTESRPTHRVYTYVHLKMTRIDET